MTKPTQLSTLGKLIKTVEVAIQLASFEGRADKDLQLKDIVELLKAGLKDIKND